MERLGFCFGLFPGGMAVTNSLVYVSDWRKVKIVVFTHDGKYLYDYEHTEGTKSKPNQFHFADICISTTSSSNINKNYNNNPHQKIIYVSDKKKTTNML